MRYFIFLHFLDLLNSFVGLVLHGTTMDFHSLCSPDDVIDFYNEVMWTLLHSTPSWNTT